MSFLPLREAVRARIRAICLFGFSLALLIGALFATGISDAAKIPNSLKSNAKKNREARVKLYQRTLKNHLASDPFPLIDLEISLDRWKSAAGLIESMDRAGVALVAVTSANGKAIQKAVERFTPGD